MNFTKTLACLTAGVFAFSEPAKANEWVFGVGFVDFSRETSVDSAVLAIEYHHTPFHQSGDWSVGWGATVSGHDVGDVFLGAGLVAEYALSPNWIVEGSVMPGAFFENLSLNDLGSTFEIRTLLGIGYRFESGNRLSLAITHKSNASTAPINPGVNSLLLRWHTQF